MKCPYCNQEMRETLENEEVIDDTAVVTVRYTCVNCIKEFEGTTVGEINFWHPEEVVELGYFLGAESY